MITVADILALPAFEEVAPIAKCPHAGTRPVHNVGILDCPPDYNKYSVYYPGEFIVTNLGFANNNERVAEESLCAMMSRGVSGIAIKTVYNPPITDRVRQTSEKCGVPVYLYTGAFHEMVAYQALDLIRRDEQESNRNEAIDALLAGQNDEQIRRKIYDIASITGATMNCFAIAPQANDESSLYAVLGMVQTLLKNAEEQRPEIDSTFACRFHGCALALVSYGTQADGDNRVVDSIAYNIANSGPLCCGIGSRFVLASSDLSIRQALACLTEARKRGVRKLSWQELGMEAFSLSAKTSPLFSRTCAMYRSMLQAYDNENSTDLMQTARALADALGDVKAAADSLFQHPNTIRYRLKKIKAVLNLEYASDKELVAFLILTFLA